MRRQDYTVGWICGVNTEYVAARELLDDEHPLLPSKSGRDSNAYTLGRIGDHNVVIACLPKGKYGIVSAASVAQDMLRSFESIRFGLMVGTGGGAPSARNDIRLGDVVVGIPQGRESGVIAYNFGKARQNREFEITQKLNAPPTVLLTALNKLEAIHMRKGNQITKHVSSITDNERLKKNYERPGVDEDRLYSADYVHHKKGAPCKDECAQSIPPLIVREARGVEFDEVAIHYGLIASADQLVEDAILRDKLIAKHNVLCFETEAAGLMDNFPCVVIRGICNYSDSHKNDTWQGYAAAAAASYAKELLCSMAASGVPEKGRATDEMRKQEPYSFGLNLGGAPQIDESAFIGRETELASMRQILVLKEGVSAQKVLVLSGLGGMGKTQLSIKFAKRYRDSFDTIYWMNAESETLLRASFVGLAERVLLLEHLRGTGPEAEDKIVRRMRDWLSETGNRRWLLIFDNYDDPQIKGIGNRNSYDIRKYFPYVSQGSILITTRYPRLTFGNIIWLKKLEVQEGLAVLVRRSGRVGAEKDDDAYKLAERLDGLPLALATAGDYLSRTSESPGDFLNRYEQSWQELQKYADELLDYEDRTLYTTWNISFSKIEVENEDTAKLMRLLAYCDSEKIQLGLLENGSD